MKTGLLTHGSVKRLVMRCLPPGLAHSRCYSHSRKRMASWHSPAYPPQLSRRHLHNRAALSHLKPRCVPKHTKNTLHLTSATQPFHQSSLAEAVSSFYCRGERCPSSARQEDQDTEETSSNLILREITSGWLLSHFHSPPTRH